MSVTTSAQFNQDKFDALIPQGTTYGWVGAAFEDASEKTITATCTDVELQAAVTSAAAEFVDYAAIRAGLKQRALAAIDTNIAALGLPDPTPGNTTYLGHAAIPGGTLTAAQLSGIVRTLSDQVDALARQANASYAQLVALTKQNTILIRLMLNVVSSSDGTGATKQ